MRVWTKPLAATLAILVAGSVVGHAGQPQVDENLPHYKKVDGVSGSLNAIGSDTMNNLMKLWGEAFRQYYPGVTVQVEGKGSSTAPPALIAGTAQLGPMSRAMKPTELDDFEKKYGYQPTQIRTSIDALAVFVNKDNPVKGLTLPKLDAIFSKTRKLGYTEDVTTWGQVGLTGEWSPKPLSLYGRNSASGTYGYFKNEVLGQGDYKDEVKEQPGSASVVQGVSEDKYAIGYSGIGYLTSGVRAVPLAKEEGGAFVEPNFDNVLNHTYPLARYLFIYLAKQPNHTPDPVVLEFMKFVLSREGQDIVVKEGYLPIAADVVKGELAKLTGEGAAN